MFLLKIISKPSKNYINNGCRTNIIKILFFLAKCCFLEKIYDIYGKN